MKILFISAEVAPFSKTGGLGDVCGSLPKALRVLGHDVRVISPAYHAIEEAYTNGKWNLQSFPGTFHVPTGAGLISAGLFGGSLPGTDVPVYFIAQRDLFDRANVYGYNDDGYRFGFFSRAALEFIRTIDWYPDVVHGHDWHAAPALTWLATSGQFDERYRKIARVFTIHNLAHQGHTPSDILAYMGIDSKPLHEEKPGIVNFMARGIYHATMINTVSPTYSREIMTPQGGAGLHGLLHYRHYDVHGILNGIDYELWDPTRDVHLAHHFGLTNIDERLANKTALQSRLGLPQRPEVPLISMISRLDRQKGLDIVGHPLHLLLNGHAGEAQFVVLGTGAKHYEDMFRFLSSYHSDRMAAILTYAADAAPLIYGGSDLFLMPSLFEPCGLGQMIAMRYGAVPVVRQTGGLADTVRESVTGFTFYDYTPEDLWNAITSALYIYRNDKSSWNAIQRNGMTADFSWEKSAYGYQQLYDWAVARELSK